METELALSGGEEGCLAKGRTMSYAIACCFVVHVDDDHLRVHGALALSPMFEGLLKSVWFTNR